VCYFDGNLPHCTLDITGNQERFSLIYFCTQGAVSDKFDAAEKEHVQSMGFVLPPASTRSKQCQRSRPSFSLI
jgi:hypothetical protein